MNSRIQFMNSSSKNRLLKCVFQGFRIKIKNITFLEQVSDTAFTRGKVQL